jgi:predicted permease
MKATLPPTYRPDMAGRYLSNKLTANAGGTGVSGLRREYEKPLWLLMAITGLVLLIACANLANLLLARAGAREREIAVRLALGASRRRLVRQLLAESVLLAAVGAVLGVALAQLLSRGLVAFLSTENDRIFVAIGVDLRVLGFTTALAAVTCILFGLVPAIRASHLAPAAAMRTGGWGSTAGRERSGLRRVLVAGQIALSFVLLVGALLFVRSLHNLLTVHAGFRPEGVVAVNLDLRKPGYDKKRLPIVYREILERLSGLPGVLSAAQALFTPVSGSGWNNSIGPDNAPAENSGKESHFNRVSPGYFRTMGTALIAGRDFNDKDTPGAPHVAVVNEMFARKYFDGRNPVGRTFRLEAPAGEPEKLYQIVGMVENAKYYELREDFMPVGFFPIAQDEEPGAGATFVLRAGGPVGELLRNAQSSIAQISPGIGLEFRFLSRQLEESLMRERLMATLSGGFALLAALLATLGLYGVIAYMIARRQNEIGVRIALGADRGSVILLVLREAGLLVSLGLAAGAALSLWLGKTAATLLFGLQPHDVITLVSAAVLLAAAALISSYLPARRAAAIEPMAALRID